MRVQKTAYELSESQVQTPKSVISFFWKLVHQSRSRLASVLDLGAGDGRFARGGKYENYVGIEIDPRPPRGIELPSNATIKNGCAFEHRTSGYEACIGNPPYVQYHDIEEPWKSKTIERIKKELSISLDGHCNLYLYFLCLALMKSSVDGLVALVIPYEWVSRPSAKAVRARIKKAGWDVSVYCFRRPIFRGVLTTASITIIDKSSSDGEWKFFNILDDDRIKKRRGITGTGRKVLEYAPRSEVWARRGISPGGQKIFVLTEAERIHHGLHKTDVSPCVTSLRELPDSVKNLDRDSFRQHYVEAGKRCWLIRSASSSVSTRLRSYLQNVPKVARENYTCTNQDPWYAYESVPAPKLLVSSAFTGRTPKTVTNSIGAKAVGVMYGVHSRGKLDSECLRKHLSKQDLKSRIVAHAKTLRKIEVRQLNAILTEWANDANGG